MELVSTISTAIDSKLTTMIAAVQKLSDRQIVNQPSTTKVNEPPPTALNQSPHASEILINAHSSRLQH